MAVFVFPYYSWRMQWLIFKITVQYFFLLYIQQTSLFLLLIFYILQQIWWVFCIFLYISSIFTVFRVITNIEYSTCYSLLSSSIHHPTNCCKIKSVPKQLDIFFLCSKERIFVQLLHKFVLKIFSLNNFQIDFQIGFFLFVLTREVILCVLKRMKNFKFITSWLKCTVLK